MMIALVTFIIAVLGLLLVINLTVKLLSVDNELKLKKHRSTQAGLADLLNYAAVIDDGVIVCKSGALMAAWIYTCADDNSSTHTDRNVVSQRINQAIARLGDGWVMHVDAVRRLSYAYPDSEKSHFEDEITQGIDNERRYIFNSLDSTFEGYFVLTLTYFPPSLRQTKFTAMMFDDDGTAKKTNSTINVLNSFKREIRNVEDRLSAAVNLTRLKGNTDIDIDGKSITYDDFLSWLNYCVTGTSHPIRLPDNAMYIDSLIGNKEMFSGIIPKIGRNYIQFVAIDGFPQESFPGILNSLAELGISYRWSSRFIFLEQHQAAAMMDKYRKKWRQKTRGLMDQIFNTNSGAVDIDALEMMQDAELAMSEINSGFVGLGYYTSGIIIYNEDIGELEEQSLAVEKTINKLGFSARTETLNTMEAFFGSLPGHAHENIRRPLLNTLNLADLLPTSSIWTGEHTAPCPFYEHGAPPLMYCVTSGATPFRLNLHVGDVGHTFMFGPTGAGKSTHLALIAAQLRRYKGMTIFAFDKGMSMFALTKAVGGSHFAPASDDDALQFCPLQYLETDSDCAWATEWVDTIMRLNGVNTTAEQRNIIANAIQTMRHSRNERSLSALQNTIQDLEMRPVLAQYTVSGVQGRLMDAVSDNLAFSKFTTFEIEELMNLDEKFALPILLYLFRRIEKSLNGQPAALILDEAWLMLGNAVFRDKIKEWLKVLRKANCVVIMATQSLSDAANSGILDVIVESTATKIYLPNAYANNDANIKLYQAMGLNEQQINIIANAEPKRQYYYMSSRGSRLYELALGQFSLAFLAASDKESVQEIKRLEHEFGDNWQKQWLLTKDIKLEEYL